MSNTPPNNDKPYGMDIDGANFDADKFVDFHETRAEPGDNGTPIFLHPRKREEFFVKGQELFNDEKFFEAHEEWEKLWMMETGRDRIFIQALIQIAGHYVLLRKRVWSGAVRLADLSKQKLILPPNQAYYRQFDIVPLISALNYNLHEISMIQADLTKASMLNPTSPSEVPLGVDSASVKSSGLERFLVPKLF